MLEKNMRKKVVKLLKGLDAVSIENGVGAGTPDVNFVGGWLELKSVDKYPPRGGPVRLPHFTPAQKAWIVQRANAGGYVGVLLKVEKDLYLFGPDTAVTYLDDLDRKGLMTYCDWHCHGWPDAKTFVDGILSAKYRWKSARGRHFDR